MFNMFQTCFNIPGALAANHVFKFMLPCDATLMHVSLSQSAANLGTLKVGTAADDDGFVKATNFPNATAAELDERTDFDGDIALSQFPHIAAGTIVSITVTDHASHMSNVHVALTFTQG